MLTNSSITYLALWEVRLTFFFWRREWERIPIELKKAIFLQVMDAH